MKLFWSQSELKENFTLNNKDLIVLANRGYKNRLGLAILMKYVQHERKFPSKRKEVPLQIVNYISVQLEIDPAEFKKYDFENNNREIKRHRAFIRKYYSLKTWNRKYVRQLSKYLIENVIPNKMGNKDIKQKILKYLYDNSIEPPSNKYLSRIINSSIYNWESGFFNEIYQTISTQTKTELDKLLNESKTKKNINYRELKTDKGNVSVITFETESKKLEILKKISLNDIIPLLQKIPPEILKRYKDRIASEPAREIRRHPAKIKYAFLSIFVYVRSIEMLDFLGDLLIQILNKMKHKAEKRIEKDSLNENRKVKNKNIIFYNILKACTNYPNKKIKDIIFPILNKEKMTLIIEEYESKGISFKDKIITSIIKSYSHHYRHIMPIILRTMEFNSNNSAFQPIIDALSVIKKYSTKQIQYYPKNEKVPTNGIISPDWNKYIYQNNNIKRVPYELCVLLTLKDKMRCRETWLTDSDKYKNPDDDLPKDFDINRQYYLQKLDLPIESDDFISNTKNLMNKSLKELNDNIPNNPNVEILSKKNGWIKLSPLVPQPEPKNLGLIRTKVIQNWGFVSLLDILKEVNYRVNFTKHFRSVGQREVLDRKTIQKRLLLSIYGLGTNMGIKRISIGNSTENYTDLQYVKRRYLYKEPLRNAIIDISNSIMNIRQPDIWGEATTACASDSKRFGSWDQNILTEWVNRHGGRVIKIYWHVEKKATCVYSQLKSCSASETIAMIEGIINHNTEMNIEKQFVDSHGQSLLAFAVCHLLDIALLPRLKGIHQKKLYRPYKEQPEAYPNLKEVMSRPINWNLIRNQYDQMIKYVTAIKEKTANVESILKRFTKENLKHPTYQAFL